MKLSNGADVNDAHQLPHRLHILTLILRDYSVTFANFILRDLILLILSSQMMFIKLGECSNYFSHLLAI